MTQQPDDTRSTEPLPAQAWAAPTAQSADHSMPNPASSATPSASNPPFTYPAAVTAAEALAGDSATTVSSGGNAGNGTSARTAATGSLSEVIEAASRSVLHRERTVRCAHGAHLHRPPEARHRAL